MTPEDIRNLKNNLFTCHDEVDDCFNAVNDMFHSKKHKASATLLVAMTVNTTLELCAQALEEELELEGNNNGH